MCFSLWYRSKKEEHVVKNIASDGEREVRLGPQSRGLEHVWRETLNNKEQDRLAVPRRFVGGEGREVLRPVYYANKKTMCWRTTPENAAESRWYHKRSILNEEDTGATLV